MIYQIRVKRFMAVGSSPLEMFFSNPEEANKKADSLNEHLPMYFVEDIKLQDEDEPTPEVFDKVFEVRSSNFGKVGTSSLAKPQFFKNEEKAKEAVKQLNTYLHAYSYIEIPLDRKIH